MTDDRELDLTSAYLDGELTEADRALVEERVAASTQWRTELAEVDETRALLRGLAPPEAPEGFWDRVSAAVEADTRTESESESKTGEAGDAQPVPITAARGRGSRRALVWVAAAAAAIVFVAAVVVVPRRDAVRPNVAAATTQHATRSVGAGDALSGLVPTGPLRGLRR